MSAWCWTPNSADKKRLKKAASVNSRNKKECAKGHAQYIGRPQGPKAKGHKTPATGTLPYMRYSVVGKG